MQRDVIAAVLGVLVLSLSYQYAKIAPFSKIEESFNTQAIHDMLFIGVTPNAIAQYDNTAYPSVVPRTFIGSLVIAALASPFKFFFTPATHQGWQLLTRLILGALNVFALADFSHTLKVVPRRWFLLFTLAQFHVTFYVSRMLPNMFAFPVVIVAYTAIQQRRYVKGLVLLTATGIIFRGELAALVIPLAIALLFIGAPITQIVKAGVIGVVVGCALTIGIDSYFTGRLTFPELEGFIFNVVEGKASDWGVQPWWAYAARHVPNILGDPLIYPAAVAGLFVAPKQLKALGWASVAFIAAYSFQPHKELRFVIYAVPILTALASESLARLSIRRVVGGLVIAVFLASVALTLGLSLLKAHVSSFNYPGGQALQVFHDIVPQAELVNKTVHIDVLSFRTGHTRFGEEWRDDGVIYHRTEDENVSIESLWPTFDFIIGEVATEDLKPSSDQWTKLATIQAYNGVNVKVVLSYAKLFVQSPKLLAWVATDEKFQQNLLKDVVKMRDAVYIYKRIS